MRFVVCGEALIDLIPDDDVTSNPSVWRGHCGGGPFNTAVALARLGRDSQFLGRMGNDAFASQLEAHLKQNNVGLDLLVNSDQPTSLAAVSLDEDGKALYTFHFNGTSNFGWRTPEFPVLRDDDWLHFGSIAAICQPGATAMWEFVGSAGSTVSYDVNVRPSVEPDMEFYLQNVERIMRQVGSAGGIVKSSDEDIYLLLGADADPVSIARSWLDEFGLKMFLMTLGADGAIALLPGGQEVRVPGHQIKLADTVGAGDTFMAGFLAYYYEQPEDVEAALRAGVGAAALVCQQHGAHPPTRDELETFIGWTGQ